MDWQTMYQRMYVRMFHAVADAQKHLCAMNQLLKTAQQECEEIFMQAGGEEPPNKTE